MTELSVLIRDIISEMILEAEVADDSICTKKGAEENG